MLDKMRDNAQSWVIKALFALIILAFVFTFAMPGGRGAEAVVYVYDQPISVEQFQRNLPRGAADDPAIKQAVLGQLVQGKLLEHKASSLGVGISDTELVRAIESMEQFQANGKFNYEVYKDMLGKRMEAFEQEEKTKLTIGRLLSYMELPAMPTEAEARELFLWRNERVALEYVLIDPSKFEDRVSVDDVEIMSFYQNNQGRYLAPAKINFRYLTVSPELLASRQEVTEQEIEDYYNTLGQTLIQERQTKLQNIVLPMNENASSEEIAKLEGMVKDIVTKLDNGADFKQLAESYSDEPVESAWIDTSAMSDEFRAAVLALSVGEVSDPIITPGGVVFVKLEDMTEPRQMTLDESREIIHDRLAKDKAAKAIGDVVEKIIVGIHQSKDMAVIAEELDIPTEESGLITLSELEQNFGMSVEAADTLFSLPEGTSTTTPLRIREGGYILAEKIEELTETVLAVEFVADDIRADMLKAKSLEYAMVEAGEILNDAMAGEAGNATHEQYLPMMVTTASFDRGGPVPGIVAGPELVADAFSVREGQWLPKSYLTRDGIVVARLAKRISADEDMWEAEKETWTQAAGQLMEQTLLQSVSQSLFLEANDQGKIEVVRQDLLN